MSLPRLVAVTLVVAFTSPAFAGPKPDSYWQVEDVRPGMKGVGKTVMAGTKIESFQAEVIGVLKNTSPGRDMVLCRLSGLNLDHTGVIAGMSGSPVYIEGKLLGAVAYAWAFGKEPIAGITPFSQMHGFAESFEKRDQGVPVAPMPRQIGLKTPLRIGDRQFDAVSVAGGFNDEPAKNAKESDDLWLVPLRMPVAASGFSNNSLALLRERLSGTGLVPVQGGAVTAQLAAATKNVELEPGGPLAVAMVTGDFDLSGIGTVTHIEKDRVYGWGHPFFGLGDCEFPLMTGYIHTIYPRQTVSFKVGSPLRTVGVINADTSTGIAGWLGKTPDMLPVSMSVRRENAKPVVYNVEVVRQRALVATLVFTSLCNSVDMQGQFPEELTADLKATIEIEGRPPIVIQDMFSGGSVSGGRGPSALYQPIGNIINLLAYNPYQPVRIKRVDCQTVIRPGRKSAEIEAVEADSTTLAPGETLKVTAFVRPYQGMRERVPIELKLPADLAEGNYSALLCDDLTHIRHELRDKPHLSWPQDLDQVFEMIQLQAQARRTNLVLRLPMPAAGVALGGQPLPSLPPSMVQIFSQSKRTGAQTVGAALAARQQTPWVISGNDTVRFTVTKNKRTASID